MLDEKDLQALAALMDAKLQPINEHLDEMGQRLNGIDLRLDGIDDRLDRMDRRLDGIDDRFDGMDERLDGIDARLSRVEEHGDVTRNAVNTLLEWAEDASVTVRVPLFRKAE